MTLTSTGLPHVSISSCLSLNMCGIFLIQGPIELGSTVLYFNARFLKKTEEKGWFPVGATLHLF